MTTFIIFLLVAVVGYFTRTIWSGLIVKLFRKGEQNKPVVHLKGAVFSPQGTTRTFIVAIDIKETGDGTAKISLSKVKE